jgi:hypothetical protein
MTISCRVWKGEVSARYIKGNLVPWCVLACGQNTRQYSEQPLWFRITRTVTCITGGPPYICNVSNFFLPTTKCLLLKQKVHIVWFVLRTRAWWSWWRWWSRRRSLATLLKINCLAPRLTRECPSLSMHCNAFVARVNHSECRLDLDRFEAGKWTLSDDEVVMT